MKNGIIKLVNDRLQGTIRTLSLAVNVWLEPNKEARSDKAPKFLVMARAPDGVGCQIGVAFEHTVNKGSTSGLPMYQITLEDPSLSETPLHFSAFPNLHQEWVVQIERKRQQDNKPEVAAVNGAGIPGDFGQQSSSVAAG